MRNENGHIWVNAGKSSEYAVISIKDDGVGMTGEEIDGLLADKTDRDKKVGMGIGLSYVKRMLNVYYGESALLEIKSAIGQGTEFKLHLPLAMRM